MQFARSPKMLKSQIPHFQKKNAFIFRTPKTHGGMASNVFVSPFSAHQAPSSGIVAWMITWMEKTTTSEISDWEGRYPPKK